MFEAVADDEVVHLEDKIVAAYLVEYLLGDGDVGRFVLDDHAGTDFAVVEHGVAAAAHAVEPEGNFVGQQGGGIRFVLY